MRLSCSCGYDDYEWYYDIPFDEVFSACSTGKCYGCGNKISIGDEVNHITSIRYDEEGYEEFKVKGRICSTCADMHENLTELGFCLDADNGFIKEAMVDYQREYVKQPTKGATI